MVSAFHSDQLHVSLLADLCAGYGLRKIVISPGSRNGPLAVAFHNHPKIECYIIPDERSAAYFALGIAQFTQQPIGIICTSGTAALNYTPAVAEAFHQQLPLVVITADRPPEWVGQGDGQTINQTGIFSNFVTYQAQLPVDIHNKHDQWLMERQVRDGFLQTIKKQLPIHFNIPIREPLYNGAEQRITQTDITVTNINVALDTSKEITTVLLPDLLIYNRILIVVGMKRPEPLFLKIIEKIAATQKVVILAENLSNISSECVFQVSDPVLFSIQESDDDALKPELVISFGDMLLSKPLKQWMRKLNAKHWVIQTSDNIPDVFQHIDAVFTISSVVFLQELMKRLTHSTDYYTTWERTYSLHAQLHQQNMQQITWSDMQAFDIISKNVPEGSIVHLGNSSPVRYAQLLAWDKSLVFYGNRGTAGIDGCLSTALGMANQTDKLVTLIIGDMSFLYDSNGLWNNYKKSNLKIIVINNKGGNIFSLIAGPDKTGILESNFQAYVPVSIEHLCKAYQVDYFKVGMANEMEAGIKAFYATQNCSVLEVQTDAKTNTSVWKTYYQSIKTNMSYGK